MFEQNMVGNEDLNLRASFADNFHPTVINISENMMSCVVGTF